VVGVRRDGGNWGWPPTPTPTPDRTETEVTPAMNFDGGNWGWTLPAAHTRPDRNGGDSGHDARRRQLGL